MSLSSHQSHKMGKDEWLTPPEILSKLGRFNLDPCSPVNRPWDTANLHYSIKDDGLSYEWSGRVWLNPPFGKDAARWMKRMAEHNNGIALLPARTETKMFFSYVWGRASGICFLRGRPHFHHVSGERASFNSGAPICLISYGLENLQILFDSNLGAVVKEAAERVDGRKD